MPKAIAGLGLRHRMMFPAIRLSAIAVALSAAVLLSGCGGGSAKVRTPTDDNTPPPVHTVELAGLHGLGDWLTANPGGTVVVPAGDYREAGGVRFSCPAGGADCAVAVRSADGSIMISSTGGMASADVVNPPYWILQSADSLLMSDSLVYSSLRDFRVQADCAGTTCTNRPPGFSHAHHLAFRHKGCVRESRLIA